jgi:hypothetical protein
MFHLCLVEEESMNFSKYDPLSKKHDQSQEPMTAQAAEDMETDTALKVEIIRFEKLPLQSWKDSEAVTTLSDYLKGPASGGIRLVIKNDSFSLKFEPGLRPDRDPKRWQSATEAYSLLMDALDDLLELKDLGLINPVKS